ncbi:hypothetical protein BH11PLA2_BH11PLA2_43140 [soil metagenome]
MKQVNNYLVWLGHAGDGRDFSGLFERGIQAVVQLAAEETPLPTPRELLSFRFPLVDGSGNDPKILNLAIRTVTDLIQKQIPTLVCCGAGMSRSPAIVAAALSIVRDGDLDDCLKIVAQCRPHDLSPALWADVKQLMPDRPQSSTTISFGRYRHYKGNEYTVIGIARHSETEEELVVYRQEYGDRSLWVRPLKMFVETVNIDRKDIPRFQFLGVD